MSGRPCASASCCTAVCNPYVCTAPAPVLTLNWGQAAYAATQSAVVGVTTRTGTVLGSGFWVTARVVVTAWVPVQPQTDGLHVVAFQVAGTGPPLVLDAVLAYAIPTLNLAFLVVNPQTVAGLALAPTLLTMGLDAAVGQDVFVLGNPSDSGIAGNVLATGTLANVALPVSGYVTHVTTDIFALQGGTGTPILRAVDYAVVGMYQLEAEGLVQGLDATQLSAGIRWALVNCPLLKANYLLGVGTPLQLQRALALGVAVPSEADSEAPIPFAYVPLAAAGPTTDPDILELGVPAAGAYVGLAEPEAGTVGFATPPSDVFALTLAGPRTVSVVLVPGPTAAVVQDVGYIRRTMPNVWQDIAATGTVVSIDPDTGYGLIPLADDDDLYFRIAASANTSGDYVDATWADTVCVSPLGMVSFLLAGLTTLTGFVTPDLAVAVAGGTAAGTAAAFDGTSSYLYWAAPFVSSAFAGLDGGGFPLTVYQLLDTTTDPAAPLLIVQWTGASLYGVPVSFQVQLAVGPQVVEGGGPNPWPGQVTFAYPPDQMLPGWWQESWAVGTGLTGARLPTIDSATIPQIIQLPQLPTKNDAVYFGQASQAHNLTLTPTNARGLQPPYVVGARAGGPNANGLVPLFMAGTVVAADLGATARPFFQYGLYTAGVADPEGAVRNVVALGGAAAAAVGTLALNQTSLADVVTGVGLLAAGTAPVPVTPVWRVAGFTAPQALTVAQTSLLLGSGVALGAVSGTSGAVTTTSYAFAPAATPGFTYGGVVCTVPSLDQGAGLEPVQAQLRTVTGTINFVATPRDVEDPVQFVLSLAQADGSMLRDDFVTSVDAADPAGCTTVIVTVVGTTVQATYRNGYGNLSSTTTVGLGPTGSAYAVPFTLTYAADEYKARVNALVLGRPPTEGFSVANDVLGLPTPSMAATVQLTSVVTSFRTLGTYTDSGNTYAVVNGFQDFYGPYAGFNPF